MFSLITKYLFKMLTYNRKCINILKMLCSNHKIFNFSSEKNYKFKTKLLVFQPPSLQIFL